MNAKGEINGFLLAGADGKYFPATAAIEGEKIILTSEKVPSPAFVKYGFSKSPFLNIYNKDGFLMSPFRTDRYNLGIDLLDYSDGAAYTPAGGSPISCEVISTSGGTGLKITKAADENGYGIVALTKWGAIGYDQKKMKIRVIGTNSGAKVLFRIREGSYEIWAYSFTDDFTGEREFIFPTSEFRCVDSPADGVLDLQAVMNIDLAIEADGAASVTFLDVKFIGE